MTISVPLKLRTCTVCGHHECPCCRTWCDEIVGYDDHGYIDACACFGSGCHYDTPPDTAGYALLDAALKQVGFGATIAQMDENTVRVTRRQP